MQQLQTTCNRVCKRTSDNVQCSPKFISAVKGPFIAGKAKNMGQRHNFLGGGGGVVDCGTWPRPHWEM